MTHPDRPPPPEDVPASPVPPAVITGGTSGIGRALALELARRGQRVLITGRDPARGEEVREGLVSASGGAVEFLRLDLSSLALVQEGARALRVRFPRIGILVNNAGVYSLRPRRTADGLEVTMAVNYLGPFLLTRMLLPSLVAAAPSRILNIVSKMERYASNDFAKRSRWRANRSFGFFPYARSKRALVLFTRELARRLEGTGVTVNCIHPGFVATELLRDLPGLVRRLYEPVLRTPDESGRMLADLLTLPGHEGVSGGYFMPDARLAAGSRGSNDAGAMRELWRVSSVLVGADESI